MKTKNKDKTPKFIALAVICLLVGASIGLVSYHYLSDLAIFQGMKLPEENPAKLIYPNDVINTIFDDSEKINNTAGFLIKCYKPLTENQIQVLRDSSVKLLQTSEIATVYHSLIEENKVEEVESLDFVEYIYPYKTRIYTANKSKTFKEEFEGVLEDRFQSALNSYWQRGETPPPMNPHGYFYLITDDKEYHISSSQLGKIVVKYEDFPIFKNLRKPAKIIGNVSDGELYPDKIIIGSVIYEKQTTNIEPTKEMVEKIVLYEDGPQEVIDPKTKKGIAIASLLTRKLHELNLQATCVFSEEDIYEMKKGRIGRRMDRMVELVLKNPIDIVISQWVEPEERYHIPVDEKGYRILENVKTALFILEDKGGGGLESHILVGHEVEGKIGYSCWAIQQEGSTELDKNWIKQIEKTLTLEEFCGQSTYGNCSSDSDCTAGWCSGQVCLSKYEEPVITTCEWRDCFDASKYGLKCRCIDDRCQWSEIEPTKEVPTMTDIPHLTPQPGEYFTYRGNKTQILLNDSRLKYCFLELKDICPPDAANVGDIGIVITGTIKNEYDGDYYICMAAHAFNSEGKQIGGSIDPGPVCGIIAPYVKSGQTRDFELHLKNREDIERIELSVGCVSEIPPP